MQTMTYVLFLNTTVYLLRVHYIDAIMTTMASQITSLAVVYWIVIYAYIKKKISKLRVTGLCAGNSPGPVNSPHKGPVTQKMFPFDDVIIYAPFWPPLGSLILGSNAPRVASSQRKYNILHAKPQIHHHFMAFNTLRPRHNGRHYADDIFKWNFLNENVWISIKISLKFVPRGPINNSPTLVQVMTWRRPGDKPLSEPMMVWLPTHICVTRPQWVNSLRPSDAYMRQLTRSSLVQIMACLFDARSLSE